MNLNLPAIIGLATQGPPRKYYKLTEQGEVFLGELEISWKELNDTVNHIANR